MEIFYYSRPSHNREYSAAAKVPDKADRGIRRHLDDISVECATTLWFTESTDKRTSRNVFSCLPHSERDEM